jgi:heme-degrading monooxygenase HmoA
MICRIWHGWTPREQAPEYESLVRGTVIPEIEARGIQGFRSIELMRRSVEDGVEFVTIMWFDDVEAVRRFMGQDYEVAHVPEAARALLARFDQRSAHYEVLDRRVEWEGGVRMGMSETRPPRSDV